MSETEAVKDLRGDAKRVYQLLREQFETNGYYWRLGCCFDTMTDCLRILGPDVDANSGLPKLALTRYHLTSGNWYDLWYDDFAWWSIAAAKAYDPAFASVFGEFAEPFKQLAQVCWSALDRGMYDGVHNGAPHVFTNKDNEAFFKYPPLVPEYWVTPRFDTGRGSGLHGVWQKDVFANARIPSTPENPTDWVGLPESDPNPSRPTQADGANGVDGVRLGPYQLTVVNALYLLNAVRLEQARTTHPDIPRVEQQMLDEYGFLRTWMGKNSSLPVPDGFSLLNEEFNDGTAVVLERVSTYADQNGDGVFPQVENWDARTSWAGDQGLIINGLAGYLELRPTDTIVPPLLYALLFGYARHVTDTGGVPQKYFPLTGNKLERWDPGDYACGIGVFMRGVLQAARISAGPVAQMVRAQEFQDFLKGAANWASAEKPTDLFGCFNVLATLLTAIELIEP